MAARTPLVIEHRCQATRPEDGQEMTEQLLDEYEEAFKLLKTYERLVDRSQDEN